MTRKSNIQHYKEEHKEFIRRFSEAEPDHSLYAAYYFGNHVKNSRCYGDLFYFVGRLSQDDYTYTLYPLKFSRRKNWFDYNSLFEELNRIYGYYFNILRYFSGFRNLRLVNPYPVKKPPTKGLHWSALYTMFLLLRKINIQYYADWANFFRYNPKANPIKTWKDIIMISEEHFDDDQYYLSDELRKLTFLDNNLSSKWVDKYLNMLYQIFGQGVRGNGNYLLTDKFNSRMIRNLEAYLGSAK